MLTNGIFLTSQVIKADIAAAKNAKYLYENNEFLNEIKEVIEKRYKEREMQYMNKEKLLKKKMNSYIDNAVKFNKKIVDVANSFNEDIIQEDKND